MSQGHKKNVSNTMHAKSPNGPSPDDSSSFLGRHIIDISISHSKRSFIRAAWLYRTDRREGGGRRGGEEVGEGGRMVEEMGGGGGRGEEKGGGSKTDMLKGILLTTMKSYY